MGAFASRQVTHLLNRWKTADIVQIAVSTVLANLAQHDPRLRRLACTVEVKTRHQLQKGLQAFTLKRRNEETKFGEMKRSKINYLKCYNCGKISHKIHECKKPKQRMHNLKIEPSKEEIKKRTVRCFKCGQMGHVSPQCQMKTGAAAESSVAEQRRRVNLCSVATSQLSHNGQSFYFCFDSVAECSLIKESVSHKFLGKRINSGITLLGIGNGDVRSTCQVLSEVIINNYVIELLFHVVLDDVVKHDVLVGQDLINQGFAVEISSESLTIVKKQIVRL